MSEDIIEIAIGGLNVTGPEVSAPKGAARVCSNLLPAPGAGLIAAGRPKVVLDLGGPTRKLLAIHQSSAYRHYILSEGEAADLRLLWASVEAAPGACDAAPAPEIRGEMQAPPDGLKNVVRVQAMGNTLILLYEDSEGRHRLCYYLYKARSGDTEPSYRLLGETIPELEIRFGLQAEIRRGDNNGAFYGSKDDYDKFNNGDRDSGIEIFSCGGLPIQRKMFYRDYDSEQPLNPENFQSTDDYTQTWGYRLSQTVKAKVNRWLRTQCDERERFGQPFLVRWALRLYDGSLTRQSPPVLMLPSTGPGPVVQNVAGADSDQYFTEKDGGIVKAWFSIWGVSARLQWSSSYNILHPLRDWRDVVKGVEVYVSAPLSRYDQEGQVSSFTSPAELVSTKDFADFSVSDTMTVPDVERTCVGFARRSLPDLYHDAEGEYPWGNGQGLSRADRWLGIVNLPEKSEQQWLSLLTDTAEFYHLASVDLVDLPDSSKGMVSVPVEQGALTALQARRSMTDDYKSHDIISAEDMYVFNSRLMLGNISRKVFPGFSPGSLIAFTSPAPSDAKIRVRFRRQTDTGTLLSEWMNADGSFGSPFAASHWKLTPVKYLYHPDPEVDRAEIEWSAGAVLFRRSVKMEPHSFLHGALWCELPWREAESSITSAPMDPPSREDMDFIKKDSNEVYSSSPANPFLFPMQGMYTVGTGSVIAIRAAVRALSQGQFGEHPLYAFTDEGIWALATAANGSFAAVQPVSRDVCSSRDSIAQTDSAIIFETRRGIMMISGVDTTLLSLPLRDGNPVRKVRELSLMGLDKLASGNSDPLAALDPELPQGGRIVYDYVGRRLWVYREGEGALVLDMASGSWGRVDHSPLCSPVEAYPHAWVNVPGGKVADLGDLIHSPGGEEILWVSRSVAPSGGERLLTVRRMVVRGDFPRGAVRLLLWASRDGRSWHVVGSSRRGDLRAVSGSGYVAFRIGLAARLGPCDHLWRVVAQVKPRPPR